MLSKSQVIVRSARVFSEQDLKVLERSESAQSNFHESVIANQNFTETEKNAIRIATAADFQTYWDQTTAAQDSFIKSHEKGSGMWAKSLQSSAVTARSFMKEFSVIVDTVRDIGAPFGGLALGTISILFAVATNKDSIERRFSSAIAAIKERLPGLKLYQHIYNEDHELDNRLQSSIVSAYEGFIDFCIVATKYYKSGGRRRWLRALKRPDSIFAKANRVQMAIFNLRHLCDELLDKRVHSIKELSISQDLKLSEQNALLLQQKELIENLEIELAELRNANDDKRLKEYQEILSLLDYSEEARHRELEEYREAFAADDQLNAVYFEQMQGNTYDLFKASQDYQSWTQSESPSMLVLSGYNHYSISVGFTDPNWLSPIAMALITDLVDQTSRPLHAYYVFTQADEPIYRSLSVILLQLLRQRLHVLRNSKQSEALDAEFYKLQKCESSDQIAHRYGSPRLHALQSILLNVLSLFDASETVHLVIDRADRCCNLTKDTDHRKTLLKTLVKMVEAARCRLKILVVINGGRWPIETRQDELGQTMEDRVIIHTARQGYAN